MSNIAIKVENLGKRYRIGVKEQELQNNWRQAFWYAITSPFAYLKTMRRPPSEAETLWALRNVSFEVRRGEVLGVIGQNGAGKSTLLKILSRVTDPSEGRAKLYGRVGSMLEIGTGFHPELTGRENIYLNGTILGMSKKEIDRKFDEIIDFSGVERFIDTPVKRFSSGMYVRLAFAVASYLETEILLIDEVLSVGDANFQKKCLGKMGLVAKEGRTVLFVSHNMPAVSALCSRAILLSGGNIILDGEVNEVINRYIHEAGLPDIKTWTLESAPGDEIVRLLSVRAMNQKGMVSGFFDVQESILLQMEYAVLSKHNYQLTPNFQVYDHLGNLLFLSADFPDGSAKYDFTPMKRYLSTCIIPANLLNEGNYTVTAAVSTVEEQYPHFLVDQAISFTITDAMKPGGARGKKYKGPLRGIFRPALEWHTEVIEEL